MGLVDQTVEVIIERACRGNSWRHSITQGLSLYQQTAFIQLRADLVCVCRFDNISLKTSLYCKI